MKLGAYHRPTSLAEAYELIAADPGARYVAGGTDLLVNLRDGRASATALVSLRRIPGLEEIDAGPPICVGGLARVADLIVHPQLLEACPVLVQAARALGSPQVRNSATVGGNLCNAAPCADLAPPLLVLNARVRLEGPDGTRELSVEEFFVGPGESRLLPAEVLTAVLFDPPAAGARGCFLSRGRVAMDLSLVSVAVQAEFDGARCVRALVAAGAVAPRPVRLRSVEALLEGQELSDGLLAEARASAAEAVSPISDVRAGADYRRHLTGVLVQRALGGLRQEGRQ